MKMMWRFMLLALVLVPSLAFGAGTVVYQGGGVAQQVFSTGPNFTGTGTNAPQLNARIFLSFRLEIKNNAGTIQHRMIEDFSLGNAPTYPGSISGASATFANTPTVSPVVGFVNGFGIWTSNNAAAIFDSADIGSGVGTYVIAYLEDARGLLNTLISPSTMAGSVNADINGVTRTRFMFYCLSTAGTFNINTTNIPSGQTIGIRVFGFSK